ncbi:MAG: hypothetical protein ACI9U2_002557 [Bradymonadia bacterium]|jgi:hypothetical protein
MESCPSCGNESPITSLHCVQCGAKLVSAAQKTQFGMPVLRPLPLPMAQADDVASTDDASDGQTTEEFEPRDLARLAMATRKTPGSALSGLGGLKSGRRPGSLLQGLPKFRGVGQSPLTSGEFNLGSMGGGGLSGGLGKGSGLGASNLGSGGLGGGGLGGGGLGGGGLGSGSLDSGSLGSGSLDKGTPGSPLNPAPGANEADAVLGLYNAAKRSSLPPEAAPKSSLSPGQVPPSVVVDADLMSSTTPVDDTTKAVDKTGDVGPDDGSLTVEERPVAHVPHEAGPLSAVSAASSGSAVAPPATTDAASVSVTDPPLPTAMRGSERAHHPGNRGVTHARVDEGGSNSKWVVIGALVLAAVCAAVWFATR